MEISPNRSIWAARTARKLGMEYRQQSDLGFLDICQDFSLFQRGKNPRVRDVMISRDDALEGLDIRIFDYYYTTGFGGQKREHYQTVFYVESKELALPQFIMQPEKLSHRLKEWLNLDEDIDFERFPKFSSRYWLKGDDEEHIRLTMRDDVLHYFSKETGWHVEGLGYFMIVYQPHHLINPAKAGLFYKKGTKMLDLFKDRPLF